LGTIPAPSLQTLRDAKGELEALGVVEARVAVGFVTAREVGLRKFLWAAGAFGDVLASEFKMHAGELAAIGGVDFEGGFEFRKNAIVVAGF
jgi:hypothetical protein